MRTMPLERPVGPLPTWSCSSRRTRPAPRRASWKAVLVPVHPPPITTTSLVTKPASKILDLSL